MAIASKGSFGVGTNTANNQTLTTHTSATTVAAVGDLVVLIVALDNNGTTDTDQGSVVTVTGGSNTWNKAAEFSNGQGAAQAGTTCAIWWTQVTTQIELSTSHTIDFLNAGSASFDESSNTGWVFTTGGTIAVVETPATDATDGADAPSLNLTTANEARLRVRGIAIESQDASQMTATDGTWTLFTNSTSAAVATAQSVRGEFKISTGTGDASNPTLAVNGDNASVYVAFKETIAHVGEERLGAVGSLSALADKGPSGAAFSAAGWIGPIPPVSLLHFDGSDTSQTFVDERGHMWIANGDAQLDNAQAKFGSTSALFDGTGDFIKGDGGDDFAFRSGNLTVDFWVRWSSAAVSPNNVQTNLYDARPASGGFEHPTIYKSGSSDRIRYFATGADRITGTTTVVADTWYHIALTRSGTSTRLFLNGTQEGSTYTDSTNYLVGPFSPTIGGFIDGTGGHIGWIDELRVVKGTAVWTSNFTPPTVPYATGFQIQQNMAAQEWLGGTGSFSADVTVVTAGGTAHVGEARFAGASSLSVDIQNTKQAASTLQGAGALSVLAQLRVDADATLQGAGSLSAEELLREVAQATFAGAGSFSVNASAAGAQVGEARFAGAGNFSANATVMQAAAATLQGAGSLSIATRQTMTAQATLQGVGSFSPLVSQAWAVGTIFAGTGNASFHGMQIRPLIPDGDDSTGGWLNEVDSLPLFPSLDEIVPLDADYIKSSAAPAVDTCKISLSNPATGTLVAPVSVLYRYGKSGSDTAVLQVRLLQGTTMIAVWQHNDIAAGFVTAEQFLDNAMIANITDWNDLFLEFTSGTIVTHMARATFAGSGVM